MKQLYRLTLIFVLLVGADAFADEKRPGHCPFCDPAIVQGQSFYEGETIRGLLNFKPQLQGHSLIITKRHIERLEELTEAEMLEIYAFIRRLSAAFDIAYDAPDFLLAIQNGKKAGQTVPHMHFHMIPRREANVWTKLRLWAHYMGSWMSIWSPMSQEEMDLEAARLQNALERVGENPQRDFPTDSSWDALDEAM